MLASELKRASSAGIWRACEVFGNVHEQEGETIPLKVKAGKSRSLWS